MSRKKLFLAAKIYELAELKPVTDSGKQRRFNLAMASPGACTINLFTAVIYGFSYKASRVFVPGKPFQPSLMFADKARAYPSEAPFRCSTLG